MLSPADSLGLLFCIKEISRRFRGGRSSAHPDRRYPAIAGRQPQRTFPTNVQSRPFMGASIGYCCFDFRAAQRQRQFTVRIYYFGGFAEWVELVVRNRPLQNNDPARCSEHAGIEASQRAASRSGRVERTEKTGRLRQFGSPSPPAKRASDAKKEGKLLDVQYSMRVLNSLSFRFYVIAFCRARMAHKLP